MSESGPRERASLARALEEEEEERLRRLDAERAEANARADMLCAQLAALDESRVARGETVATSTTVPRSPTERSNCFASSFGAETISIRHVDYVDREVPMLLPMFEKRLRGYRAIGYARGEAPLGYAEPKGDLIVEYDDGVLRTLDHESATDRDDDLAEWVP